jgi:hypothetical protein
VRIITRSVSDDVYGRRQLAAKTCCVIAACFPNVHTLDWSLLDYERRDVARRIKMCKDFAASLSKIPGSVRHFKLFYDTIALQATIGSPRAYTTAMNTRQILSVSLYAACRSV